MNIGILVASLLSIIIIIEIFRYLIKTSRKDRDKKKFTRKEFSSEWRSILKEHVVYYNELPKEKQDNFEQRVLHFLDNIKITPIETEIEDLDRLLVGCSAIIPIFGYPKWEYPNLNEVIILESDLNDTVFVKEFGEGHVLGMVGEGRLKNRMLLSKGALREGFRNDNDKKNVGIHEFVHLIDMADGSTDGIPEILLQKSYTLPWIKLMHKETQKVLEKESDINPYGATNEKEFLTVTSEYFFERPNLLKKKHPELYKKLELIFNQDMAKQEKDYQRNKKKTEINRNDPCPCGSGKKYKNCCGTENN
ncbi:zinc-dependent peptidase [Flammeovirga sp. SubArs3]|uniref:zinc-dependent peptidase n=1 Tax=Flammeovirga sp. SubArs3 TaxID=2995316 RepID=UPI00248BAD32|nr:zinc-dependent peptidase [Flammeovirga sp. SubArs3]